MKDENSALTALAHSTVQASSDRNTHGRTPAQKEALLGEDIIAMLDTRAHVRRDW